MIRWVIFFSILSLIDYYAFQAFKTAFKSVWLHYTYWAISFIILGVLLYNFYGIKRSGFTHSHSYAIALFITFFVPKLVILAVMFGEDILRLSARIIAHFSNKEAPSMPSRRKFISQIALGIAAIPFASIIYGVFKGKYNFKVIKHTLFFDDLPIAFDGYKITQISDIHSGSFDNPNKVSYAIDLINQQESDMVLFTGDMVNNRASEMDTYISMFKKLQSKDGMFSVLGNHDYGDYITWENKEAKQKNLEDLKKVHKEIGFDLLLNENRYIEKNNERIALIGVENWGKGGFKKKGDLKKASENINKDDFKILMSHDPSHWEEKVIDDAYFYHLTLSGHTHGMQFGIEIPGWIKWSPVKWKYKHWAGIYKEKGQYINVNRGFGYLAFPGRVGIWPEITVIELRKS